MAGAFSYLTLKDKLACQATVPSPQVNYGRLGADELESATDVQAVEDQESFTFSFKRVDRTGAVRAITAQMRAGRVITVVMEDGSVDTEWRVGVVTQGRGERGIITVVCVPLWFDLVERADSSTGKGWVSDLSAGERNFEYEITQRSPTSILSTYVIPNCPTWVTLGTVDPTYVVQSLSVSRVTPGALALAVRDALRDVDITCEVRLRRNGTTDYKLDLVTQIGASASTPVFHPSNALIAVQQKADPTLQATRVLIEGATDPDGFPGRWGVARWKVNNVVGNVVTLIDRNDGAKPVAFDGQFVGNYLLRVKTGRTFAITASSSVGTVTCGGGVSTLAIGEDVEFRLTEPLTNTRTTTTRYAVSAVPDGTHITCGVSVPISVDGQYTDWYARVWTASSGGSPVITTRITTSVAATDVLTVASSAGVTNAHFVEFVQLDGAGEIPSFVDHPVYSQADPVGYGIKAMELSRPMAGITQLVPNGWMRAWANPLNPPDGWVVGGAGTFTQNTSAAFTRYGGFSWKFGPTGLITYLQTPPTYLTADHGSFSARCLIYYTTFTGGAVCQFTVVPLNADGTQGSAWSHSISVASVGAATGVTEVDVGSWIELKIEGIPIDPTTAPYGVVAFCAPTSGSGNVGYIDVIEIYANATCPIDPTEFGDATALLQAGNSQLRAVASPPLYYNFTVRDLERTFPTEYARLAITIGANVRAADVEYGIDTTVRLLRRDRDLLRSDKTTLTLANRPTLLTTIQSAEAANTQQAIADAAQTGGGTTESFIAPTTDTTLTPGTGIKTPMTGAPVFSLSVGLDDVGSSVTYTPPDPSTAPTTSVAAGTLPSRAANQPSLSRAGGGGLRPPYYPVQSGELGVTDPTYPPANIRRYGAKCDKVQDDSGAVQACVTYCLQSDPPLAMDVSGISRLGSSVNIDIGVNTSATDFRIWSSAGGGFYVNSAIVMFSTTIAFTTAPVTQRVCFDGITFRASSAALAAYVLDDAKFMRTKFVNQCGFDKIKLLSAPTVYTQSIYLYDSTMVGWSGTFFASLGSTYDFHSRGNLAESGQHYVSISNPIGCSFDDSAEAMSGTALRYNGALGFDVKGYFESNDIDIDGRGLGTESSFGVNIHGSIFDHLPGGAYAPSSNEAVLWGKCQGCSSRGNYGSYKLHKLLSTSEVEIADYAATTVTNLQGKGAVIRGQVAAGGGITFGTGFTITKGAAGLYTINITVPYTAVPVFTSAPLDSNATAETVFGAATASTVNVSIRNGANTLGDCAFNFAIIGV